MATRTSNATGGGNASDTATWAGGTVPVTGDIVVIANGDIVHWDTGLTTAGAGVLLGSNASGIGDAVLINGASSSSFGTLIVDDGATLYLRGFDLTSNTLMDITRWGRFEPAPGATIVGDVAANYGSIILNRGQITAIGTAPKPILWTSPAANYSWANAIAGETFPNSGAGQWPYDPSVSIAVGNLSKPMIANAANTGIGSFGDSSLTFASQSPGTILATEVATLAAVNAVGEYYVDYDAGVVFFYHDYSAGNPSAQSTYEYLTNVKGWGVSSTQTTSFNSAVFDYCTFNYMGATSAVTDSFAVAVSSKLTAGANSAATDRLFYLKNCTAQWCNRFLSIKLLTGTALDPILITGNTFYTSVGDTTYGYSIGAYRSASDYVKMDSNILNCLNSFFSPVAPFGSTGTYNGFIFSNNTGRADAVITGTHLLTLFPNGVISGNTLVGFGWAGPAAAGRMFQGLSGTSGNRVVFSDNDLRYCKRAIHLSSHMSIQSNVIGWSLHHCIVGDISENALIANVRINNNLFFGVGRTASTGAYNDSAIQIGYNHKLHYDDIEAINNTISDNVAGLIDFGDIADAAGMTVITGLRVSNNLGRMTTSTNGKAFQRMANSATALCRIAGLSFDYNLDYNFATRYASGTPAQGTFTGITNCTGISLFGPSYAAGVSGKTLTLTVTSLDADVTVAWDGGTAQQLIFATNGTGTATAGANTSSNGVTGLYSGTITNSGAGWSTSLNNAACPAGHWIKLTGGTGSGQIRIITSNTATVLTTVPSWTVVPDATSTYAIYKSEVSCPNGAATETVSAGIDLRLLPTSTQSDTSVALTINGITGSDPLLTNTAGTTAIDFKIGSSSPAKDVGSSASAPATDYFATARPQGASFDIGFHELPSTAATGSMFFIF